MADDPRTRDRARRVAAELAAHGPDDNSVRTALLERAVDAVDRISHAVDDQQLREAVEAGTDTAFLAALSRLADAARATRAMVDPLAAAKARGEQAKRDILAAQGDMLDANQVAARLGCDLAEVEARRRQGLLIALPDEHGKRGFPAWQFEDNGLLPGLEDVLRHMNVRSPWMRAQFFLTGDVRLDGETPLVVLLRGDIDAVRRAGAAHGEQLAS